MGIFFCSFYTFVGVHFLPISFEELCQEGNLSYSRVNLFAVNGVIIAFLRGVKDTSYNLQDELMTLLHSFNFCEVFCVALRP